MDFFEGYIDFPRSIAIGQQGKLIEESDFERYEAKFGRERALGYLQALNDFTAYSETILGGGYCRNGVPESIHMVNKNFKELVDHNQKFLDKLAKNSTLNFNR
ncbi:hypothetical protein KXQ82_05705 [Mucilaginibacter sp. HMF5004]|uniref:hypothetical protein n=1 Tax=Mucilaginibacter rivuli TaxID=2857527 RepID=UPI001C602B58|nr:hypothetical protein [Mucilaginibacter rivuli]MBW4889198.1 hypothetical protein [Mucilaginibacter rivuli]